MPSWLRRLRGALGMALTWAAGGALLGGLIEAFVDPTGAIVDVWIPVLAYPGFVAGAVFSVVLGMAGRSSSFDELSLPRFAAWGAAGGALLGAGVVSVGMALAGVPDSWWIAPAIVGTTTLASAGAASATLAVARMADDRELPTDGPPRLEDPDGTDSSGSGRRPPGTGSSARRRRR